MSAIVAVALATLHLQPCPDRQSCQAEETMKGVNYQSIDSEEGRAREDFAKGGRLECRRGIANPHPEDLLVPPFEADDCRPSSLLAGCFNIVATIIGGSLFSFPVVFKRCGVAFATLAMLLSACASYASLTMLCLCGRRAGGSSYAEVVRSAYGERAEEGVSWLLFATLMFVMMGYMVLIRDIWTPLVGQVATADVGGDVVLLAVVALLLPLLFQRSLHALRWNCYIATPSIFILGVALCHGAWQRMASPLPTEDSSVDDFVIEYFKIPSLEDVLFSFPIVAGGYVCHFNIIAIQNSLRRPTRQRMQNLTLYAIGICSALMYMFGLGGYLYAGQSTDGNILLNIPTTRHQQGEGEYYLFLLGRIGCGVTVMFALPLMALPCREALLEVVDSWFHRSHHREDLCWRALRSCDIVGLNENEAINTEDEVVEVQKTLSPRSTIRRSQRASFLLRSKRQSYIIRQKPIQSDYVFRNAFLHYGSTLLIMTVCYFGAVAVSGVASLWSFVGSSVAVLIAFVIPCSCFIGIEDGVEGEDRKDGWIRVAWAILPFSVVGAVICTVNNAAGLGH